MVVRAAIYARVSTSSGKQDSTRQVVKLKALANDMGYTEVDVFTDSISGYIKNRPELGRFLETVEKDNEYYKVLFIDEISRIARNPIDARDIIDSLSKKRIPIYVADLAQFTISKDGQRNSIINIMLQLAMEFADMESQQMKERAHSGRVNKALKGEYMGGIMLPYGYDRKDKKLVINDDEAKSVKLMFQLASEGHGCNHISRKLNKLGIPTKRANISKDEYVKVKNTKVRTDSLHWHYGTVKYILENPIYRGTRETMGVVVECPSIVSPELFELVQQRFSTTKRASSEVKYIFLLKGILHCITCGRVMVGRYNPKSGADKFYCCLTKTRGANCGNGSINIDYIESVIFDAVIRLIIKGSKLKENEDLTKSLLRNIEEYENNIHHFEKLARIANRKNSKLLDLFLEDKILMKEFESSRNQLNSEIMRLEGLITDNRRKLSATNASIEGLKDVRNNKLLSPSSNRKQLQEVFKNAFYRLNFKRINQETSLVVLEMYPEKYEVILLSSVGVNNTSKKNYRYKFIPSTLLEDKTVISKRDGFLSIDIDILMKEFKHYQWDYVPVENMIWIKNSFT